MEFSGRYKLILSNVFTMNKQVNNDNVVEGDVTLDNHNAFNKMFVVDTSSDEVEVPMFAKEIVESILSQNLSLPDTDRINKIVIPLYVNSYSQPRRTADSIITEFFSKVNFSKRLQKIITTKEEVYYGGRGIILDSNFNPLILCSMLCKREKYNSKEFMDYYKPIIRISPELFINGSGLVHKTILKKVIPFYITHTVHNVWAKAGFRDKIPANTKPQILIEDTSILIENPSLPNPNTCSNEELNKLLIDNINDVLNQIE